MKLECIVDEVVPLRIPKVYRLRGSCNELSIEIEFHEDVVEIPQKSAKMIVDLSTSKDECLNHYYCAHGHIVSNTKLDEIHRIVLSLHGFLAILKSKKPLEYKTLDHLYLGVTFIQ